MSAWPGYALPYPANVPATPSVLASAVVPAWPADAAALAAAFGYGTWSARYAMQESATPLVDSIGGVNLTAASTPVYQQAGLPTVSGDLAVQFDTANDSFAAASAASHDIGTTGGIAIYACVKYPTPTAFNQFFSKGWDGTTAIHWGVLVANASGHIYCGLDDGAGHSTSNTTMVIAANHADGNWHDILLCIDRDAQRARLFSDLGQSQDIDLTAYGTLANAAPFSLGRRGSIVAALHTVAFVAIANADVTALRTNAAAAIANIRAATGR